MLINSIYIAWKELHCKLLSFPLSSLCVEPLFPQRCAMDQTNSLPRATDTCTPTQLAARLISLPCPLSFEREDNIKVIQLIMEVRREYSITVMILNLWNNIPLLSWLPYIWNIASLLHLLYVWNNMTVMVIAYITNSIQVCQRSGGQMVRASTLGTIGRWFEPQLGHT